MPLYMLGFMGATRRLDHYEASTGWQPLFIMVGVGALIILCGVCIQLFGLFKAIKERKQHQDKTGDPWRGRTLEWATASPPPLYNFAILPTVDQRDPLWAPKGTPNIFQGNYEEIHMPKDTPMGLYIGMFSLIFGFAMTWHLFWLALLSFGGILTCLVIRLSGKDEFDLIPAERVKEMEGAGRIERGGEVV